jgi:hypothetical protein
MPGPPIDLVLYRHADTAWREIVRPWLEAGRGRLERAAVVVPTRGQAHGLKQRCMMEGVALLGLEFLTPGLARRKVPAAARPPLGRELLLVGLRTLIERRLAPLEPESPEWGLWKSLQSDPERALEDFDELLGAGFQASDFPLPELRAVFGELAAWAEALGYGLAPADGLAAALRPPDPGEPRAADRLLIYGAGPECWGEFFNLAVLARRCGALTIVLPEPEWRGRGDLDERWIELWSSLLGVEPRTIDAPEPGATCLAVGGLWTSDGGSADRAGVLVGLTRADEMVLVADEVVRLLSDGARDIAVVFPRADAARFGLASLLEARGVPFSDLLAEAGAVGTDGAAHLALLRFYERGCRIEELLELWPLLRELGLAHATAGQARDVCRRLFDEAQSHALASVKDRLDAVTRDEAREVARVAGILLPAWDPELTIAGALGRFESACRALGLVAPTWPALAAFADREDRPLPARVVFAALGSFLPKDAPPVGDRGRRGGFARVTLTTRRRAAGLAWSHVVFVESNAGVWPERRESSCWLGDEDRAELNRRSRFSIGLLTSEDRAALEKRLSVGIARDAAEGVVFSAALYDDEDSEVRLAANGWLERVLLALDPAEPPESALVRRARRIGDPAADPPGGGWLPVWIRRRDPAAPFDEHFFCGDPALAPERLAAGLIERSFGDPACLWHEGFLGVRRIDWAPLVRERRKSLGKAVHRILAEALRGEPAGGPFTLRPSEAESRAKLGAELERLGAGWPGDRYWESFRAELGDVARTFLDRTQALFPGRRYTAAEVPLPAAAAVRLSDGTSLRVGGRLDLALSDRPEWRGADVDIVDFKTGRDDGLSAERMGSRGDSIQLGVYLAAVGSLGAASARVWMVKPDARKPTSLDLSDLPAALAPLDRIGVHLRTGRCGALTEDRIGFAHPFTWPVACAPIAHAVLAAKFEATFGSAAPGEEESADA